jgi:hypothetical protein
MTHPQSNHASSIRRWAWLGLCGSLFVAPAPAQVMTMGGMTPAGTLAGRILAHDDSGTSIQPMSTPAKMQMAEHGGWMLMLHGMGFASDTQQFAAKTPSGQRGGDKFFSTNWIMPMAQRKFGKSELTFRGMVSLEPATISGGYYPELFQQGETWKGAPIVDGQHPHDFVMELAAIFDYSFSDRTVLSFYAAPVGDPALGPTAFPHRFSASEDPLAALGHHQQDSTHIAFNVVTGGFTTGWARVEVSGFHGAEPDEHRWQFQPSPNGLTIDSWSSRLTVSPARNWTGQYSIARIASPEALAPDEDQNRQTASAMYNRTLPKGNWANSIIWGRTRSLTDGAKENSYLLESLVRFASRNNAWTRIENAGRSNELLLTPGAPLPSGFEEQPIGHVAAFSFGYDRDLRSKALSALHLEAAPGAQVTAYRTPAALVQTYGRHPFGVVFFVRFRVGPE